MRPGALPCRINKQGELINSARTVDVRCTTGTRQQRPESPTIRLDGKTLT